MPASPDQTPSQGGGKPSIRHYQALFQATPDPIFVADASTGELIETNEAAEELLGRSRDEILGCHHSVLHPKENEEQYRRLFTMHAENGGTLRTLPDGSQTYVVTEDGTKVPVEIRAERVELPEREVVYGVFRDITDRLEIEQKAQEQAERYRSFFENNPMNIWEVDLSDLKSHLDSIAAENDSLEAYFSGNQEAIRRTLRKIDVIDVNQNAVEYYDAASKKALIEKKARLFTEETYREFIDFVVAIVEGRTTVEIETEAWSLSGERHCELLELYVPEAFKENYERAYLITHDITDRKTRERELRSFKQAVEHAGHSVLITDEDGDIEYANPTFEEITGYAKKEVIGKNPRLLKSGAHDESFYEKLWDTILDGDVWSAEIINERKDGERVVVDQTIAPIFDDSGEIQRFVAVNQDITDRKEREREFLKLQQALDNAGNSIYITDAEGRIEYVNEAFESLSGYSTAEAKGATRDLFIPGEASESDAERLDMIKNGERKTGERILERKSGERTVVDETIAPIEDEAGLLRGFVGIQTDVTERKLREQQLAVFARVLRHNLRNEGTTIKGRAQLLEQTITEETLKSHLEQIQETIDTLLEIGEKAHHVQRTIENALNAEEERDLNEALENVTAAFDTTFSEASVTLRSEIEEAAVDPRIIPAIQELVRNAIEHSEATTPEVDIVTRRENGTATVIIEDNGPGIPADERQVIKEGTEQPLKHGSGLGLWLTYWLTTFVGGHIEIESGDSGSVVSLTVPLKNS